MEPILAFFAGLYLNKNIISQFNLQQYVQAMNELEVLMGDSSTM